MKAVFDCNVYFQAMVSARGASYACLERVKAGEVTLFVTAFMLEEIRELPAHAKIGARFPDLTSHRIEEFIADLLRVATLVPDPPAMFRYDRDPDDAHYVDAALTTGAMLVVSNDKDLLDLMNDRNADGLALRKSHPTFAVVTPPRFLEIIRAAAGGP
jgi:putative PIN family toxin of toxin-antitoxin system